MSDSWDANRMALYEWGLALAGAAVLALYELAFHPPFGAPVADSAVRLWDLLAWATDRPSSVGQRRTPVGLARPIGAELRRSHGGVGRRLERSRRAAKELMESHQSSDGTRCPPADRVSS